MGNKVAKNSIKKKFWVLFFTTKIEKFDIIYLIRESKKTHNMKFSGLFKEPFSHKLISIKMKSFILLALIFVASQAMSLRHE